MDFWLALQVIGRRWYVAVPAAVLTGVLAFVTYTAIDTRYESTAVLVLTSPTEGGTFAPGTRPEDVRRVNPLLAFDGSLTTTAQIVIQILRDPRTAAEIGVLPDSDDTFEVNNGTFGGSGPFISVVATTNSSESSTELAESVMNRAVEELETRQLELGAPPSTLITAQVLVRPTEAESLIGGKIRFAGAMFLVGIIMALSAPFAVDSLLRARAARRATRAEPDGPAAVLVAGLPVPSGPPGPDLIRTGPAVPEQALRPSTRIHQPTSRQRPTPRPRLPARSGVEATVRLPQTVPNTNGNAPGPDSGGPGADDGGPHPDGHRRPIR